MNRLTGVRAIMKDIVETLRSPAAAKFCNLSAGNPLILPEIESLWAELTREILASKEYGAIICRYGASQGYEPLLEAIAQDFSKRYQIELSPSNILVTPGSQSLYFFAANAFAGYDSQKHLRKLLLPLCPDYTGYGGVSICEEAVYAIKPLIEDDLARHRFKYHPDLEKLTVDESVGCIVFSRPCNPTGNVLSDQEVASIASKAAPSSCPVFVDSAYGPPFPALNFTEMNPLFAPNVVHCMSLSKAGLPGERIGVAIGAKELLEVLECFESNAVIHASRMGQAIVARAIKNGSLVRLSKEVIRPFYMRKLALLEEALAAHLPDDLPWRLHQGEGAIFAWLWFENLPISDQELYALFKQAGVILVPGSPFFPGLRENWQHSHECLRLSLTAPDQQIVEGVRRMGDVVRKVYSGA
jgi:valine--pyruvate aminotransferase